MTRKRFVSVVEITDGSRDFRIHMLVFAVRHFPCVYNPILKNTAIHGLSQMKTQAIVNVTLKIQQEKFYKNKENNMDKTKDLETFINSNKEEANLLELKAQIALLEAWLEAARDDNISKITDSFVQKMAFQMRIEHLLAEYDKILNNLKIYPVTPTKYYLDINNTVQNRAKQILQEFVDWRQKTKNTLNKDINLYAKIFAVAASLICKQNISSDLIRPIIEKVILEINNIEKA